MFSLNDLSAKRILILGFEREGMATLSFLLKYPDLYTSIGVADMRTYDQLSAQAKDLLQSHTDIKQYFGDEYTASLAEYDVVIRTPGIPLHLPEIVSAQSQGIRFLSATEMFMSLVQGRVIGITGSKGKSTTSTLLYFLLKEAGYDVELIGNIGEPPLRHLEHDHKDKLFVCELSSAQLEDLETGPDIGVYVSFFPDHISFHGTLEKYADAKGRLSTLLSADGFLVYNAHSDEVVRAASRATVRTLPVGERPVAYVEDGMMYLHGEPCLPVDMIQIRGEHNHVNILSALLVAHEFGVPSDIIRKVVFTFHGLPHRLQHVGTYRSIAFYDDSQSTNPDAAIVGLRSFQPGEVGALLAGGSDKGFEYDEFLEEIIKQDIPVVVFFPPTGLKMYEYVQANTTGKDLKVASSMEDAIAYIYQKIAPGKVCLLSPGAASFGMFKDMADRGDQFAHWAKVLGS